MEYGKPFCKEQLMLVQMVSKHVLNENATSSAKRAREIGLNQFGSFINDRLWNGTDSLYYNIMKTNLPLFSSKNSVVTSKSKQRIANLEEIFDSTQICLSSAKPDMAILITLHMRTMPTLSLCQNMGN